MPTRLAIIGRPNVGKSTLFNRLVGKKRAIVHDKPGVTRDRNEHDGNLGDLYFTLIDTAGLEYQPEEELNEAMQAQTHQAIEDADIVMMMIDGRAGLASDDYNFAQMIRKSNRPALLVINKCENTNKTQEAQLESYSLGLGEPVAISSEHGLGMDDLYRSLQQMSEIHGFSFEEENFDKESTMQLTLVGRPNAGKSTLFNRLLLEDRAIISDIAGTTRDAIYIDWHYKGTTIKLVDTAGIRKKAKRIESLEKMSIDDSFSAVQYAQMVILMLDATLGFEKQDATIAAHVLDEGRGLVIALNKWDLIEHKQRKALQDDIHYQLGHKVSQAKQIPLIPISALHDKGIGKMMDAVFTLYDRWNIRISTAKLNRWLHEVTERHIPPLSGGKRLRFKYITQAKKRPPTFTIFTSSNLKELPASYLRYLTNDLRDSFDMHGIPIRLLVRKSDNPFG